MADSHETSNMQRNNLAPSAQTSLSLDIRSSLIPGAGRGLFTLSDIASCQEILRSNPLVSIVEEDQMHDVCDYCLLYQKSRYQSPLSSHWIGDPKGDPKVLPCSGCKICAYCSKECQKKAWKAYHKHECRALPQLPTLLAILRALVRIIVRYDHGLITAEQWNAFTALKSHQNELLDSKRGDGIRAAGYICKGLLGTSLTKEAIQKLYCVLLMNNLRIVPPEGQSLGLSLDLTWSMVNHSCEPNAMVFFEGDCLRAHSRRALKAGEEVTFKYFDDSDVMYRRSILKSEYFLVCSCAKCNEELRTHKMKSENDPSWFEEIEKMHRVKRNILDLGPKPTPNPNTVVKLEEAEATLAELANKEFHSGPWPEHLPLMPELHLRLAQDFCQVSLPKKALKLGLKGALYKWNQNRDYEQRAIDLMYLHNILSSSIPAFNTYVTVDPNSPDVDEMKLLLRGCLHELIVAARRAFGRDTKFTMTFEEVYCFLPEFLRLGTVESAKDFEEVQSKALKWAGVEEGYGLVISGPIDF